MIKRITCLTDSYVKCVTKTFKTHDFSHFIWHYNRNQIKYYLKTHCLGLYIPNPINQIKCLHNSLLSIEMAFLWKHLWSEVNQKKSLLMWFIWFFRDIERKGIPKWVVIIQSFHLFDESIWCQHRKHFHYFSEKIIFF